MEAKRQRPRIDDVAREAGVSKTAVSFAFNNPHRLSRATASRILDVAESMGYRPDPVARMLTQRRTMSIGVMTPQALSTIFADPFFGAFAEGVAMVAEDAGYGLQFISPGRGSLDRALDRATVDGIVFLGLPAQLPEVQRLRDAGMPVVLVDSTEMPDVPSISVDDEGGAYQAASHLLDLGHRDVLTMVIAPQAPYPPGNDCRAALDRLRGYERAFRDHGVAFSENRLVATSSTIQGGRTAFSAAWGQGCRPTAVLAMSDAIAIGALTAARSSGVRIPEELSIVGFDDIDVAPDIDPPLTTVLQPTRRKGQEAIRMLLSVIGARGRRAKAEHRELETRLVIRGSTGPPPSSRRLPGNPVNGSVASSGRR